MSFAFFTDSVMREQKITSWTKPGLLVFITAFLWAPSRDGLEAIYALAFFIPMLCLLFCHKTVPGEYGGRFTGLALLFGGYSALTTFWAAQPDPVFFILQFVILATWLCGLGWMAQRGLINIALVIKLLVLAGAIISVVNLTVFYSFHPLLERLEGWSVTRNPNHIGAVYAVLSLLAYIEWLRAPDLKRSSFYLVGFMLLMLSVIASQSRAPLIGLVMLIPIAAVFYCRSRAKWLFHVVFLLILLVTAYWLRSPIQDLLLGRGLSVRDTIWADVWAQSWQHSPFWGVGLEKEGRIVLEDGRAFNHAHNAWLDMFYRSGLVAVILNLLYFGYLVRHAVSQPQLRPLILWLMLGCIYSLFDSRGFFWQIDPKWFCIWLPAGLMGALLHAQRYREVNSSSKQEKH